MVSTRRDFLRQGACALVGGAALASGIRDFGLVHAFAQGGSPATDYKALVCIFLNGGNDGNNTVVPVDQTRFAEYTSVRASAGLALPAPGQAGGLLPVNPVSGGAYGFHPAMPELKTLFDNRQLAVVTNVGTLVEPLTRATYRSGTGRLPLQLFSHSDQIAQWQTSVSNDTSVTGWGGRTADRAAHLNGGASFPQVVSIAGTALFATGTTTRPIGISDARTPLASVLPLNNPPGASGYTTAQTNARRAAFDSLRGMDLNHTLVKASRDVTEHAIQTSIALANPPSGLPALPDFPNVTLGYQLEQVARLIQLRDALGIKRQIFFCQLGAFDTHSGQMAANAHSALLAQVSQAMKAFYDATMAMGVQNSVTTFTLSDFGRTLQPAGAGAAVGTDHGWGNHHFILGGAVRGGDFYGRFPTLALNGPDDTDTRGRWIPTTSVEQYAAALATWYGLAPSDIPLVFPFINRFPTANLGFMA
ncbi:MAG TPA: DUF1501 domain-containing protein [Pyrinomonadaceae bacterium]|nr:DUF1501 domain-containing protein [Pyrinomonadaceae bacterium]